LKAREKDKTAGADVVAKLDALRADVRAMGSKTAQLKEERDKAQKAAAATIKEALSAWWRFEPAGMGADTKARIEKAVKIYTADPDKRSLAKVAKEFRVSRKTVSKWLATFTEETGFPVVIHKRHVSVKAQARQEQKAKEEEGEESFFADREEE
jgi:outer membrane murein-binding lipoprotein Lpp